MKKHGVVLSMGLLVGCAHDWRDMPEAKNLPLIGSEAATARYSRSGCIGCTTGYSSEVYFFSSTKRMAKEQVCEDARDVISPHFKDANWQEADPYFDGGKRYFTRSRIHVVSVSPMIVAMVPWPYKANLRNSFGWHHLSEEIHEFHRETKENRSPQFCWVVGSKNMIELRSTFPAEASTVQLLTKNSAHEIRLPVNPGEVVSLKMGSSVYSMERTSNGDIRFQAKQ
jgi:hypothetical protein